VESEAARACEQIEQFTAHFRIQVLKDSPNGSYGLKMCLSAETFSSYTLSLSIYVLIAGSGKVMVDGS
jgi:hypothetical protein